jgi:phage-related protein
VDETKALIVLADGPERRVVCALRQNGDSEAMRYIEDLGDKEQDKLAALFQKMANFGKLSENKFKKLVDSDGIWEFRSDAHRLLCFQDGRSWVLTHGFEKSGQKTPKVQITRAQTIRTEYRESK